MFWESWDWQRHFKKKIRHLVFCLEIFVVDTHLAWLHSLTNIWYYWVFLVLILDEQATLGFFYTNLEILKTILNLRTLAVMAKRQREWRASQTLLRSVPVHLFGFCKELNTWATRPSPNWSHRLPFSHLYKKKKRTKQVKTAHWPVISMGRHYFCFQEEGKSNRLLFILTHQT